MSWSDIKDDTIKFIQQKTGKELWIPLHPELKQLFDIIPWKAVKILTAKSGI
jgi:hypothetical protein